MHLLFLVSNELNLSNTKESCQENTQTQTQNAYGILDKLNTCRINDECDDSLSMLYISGSTREPCFLHGVTISWVLHCPAAWLQSHHFRRSYADAFLCLRYAYSVTFTRTHQPRPSQATVEWKSRRDCGQVLDKEMRALSVKKLYAVTNIDVFVDIKNTLSWETCWSPGQTWAYCIGGHALFCTITMGIMY